jgi:UDP-glucose 4-epimerase
MFWYKNNWRFLFLENHAIFHTKHYRKLSGPWAVYLEETLQRPIKYFQNNVRNVSLIRPRQTSSKYKVIIFLIGIVFYFHPLFHFNQFKRSE